MDSLQQVPLVAWCSLVSLLPLGLLLRHRWRTPGPSVVKACVKEVNDSLDQPSDQSGIPKIQVLFFHGIPSHDFANIHLTTWSHKDGFLWPQVWLPEKFPGIHVFFVKYSAGLVNPNFHMKTVGENLVSDLLQANIGQVLGCPVVLVGHCVGGLIIKELCRTAHDELQLAKDSRNNKKLKAFLESVKGVFFYSTPHHGIRPEIAKRASHILRESPLFKFFETLSRDAALLNGVFNHLRTIYSRWEIQGVGESLHVQSGVFRNLLVVEEASAREQNFNILSEDHFSVCKPREQFSGAFYHLTHLLDSIAQDEIKAQAQAQVDRRPQNLQRLPKSLVGMETVLEKLIQRLEKVVTMGLTGMGGLGKTTLAKAIFNKVGYKYEYTCFVPDVKLIPGSVKTFKSEVWKCLHRDGKKVGGEEDWSQIAGKDILLVFDDISDVRDVEVSKDLLEDSSERSRFLATFREKDIFDLFDHDSSDTIEVSSLDDNSARQLFLSYAFRDKEIPPPKLEYLLTKIVEKCEGLPLTLEVLGQWLKRERKEEVWRQTLASLERAEDVKNLNERLWSKLMPSIEGLMESELQMFLDATSFFCHLDWTLREAQAAWRAAYGMDNEMVLWKGLVDKSLVYHVEEDEKIRIHDQLRSLGQKMARESRKGRVLQVSMAMRMRLLTMNESDEKDMHALQLPCLYCADEEEKIEVQSIVAETNLDQNSSVDGKLNVSKLGVHELEKLRYCLVTHYGADDGVEVDCLPSSLVALRLYGSRTPNLAQLKRLVVLKIYRVEAAFLANSVGQLSALRILVLHNFDANQFNSVPEEIGILSKLEVLKIFNCSNVEAFPESLGNLSNLKIMELVGYAHPLPKSFGKLSRLEHLKLHGCKLEPLPKSFGHLSALSYLELKYCSELESLPDSFGLLPALSHLEITNCSILQCLPESFGHLPALNHLEITNCSVMRCLPDSFGLLPALDHLEIINCSELQCLPESFGDLPALADLNIKDCKNLRCVPETFGHLSALRRLQFYHCCHLESLPESVGKLPVLSHLKVVDCHNFQVLPESLGQLGKLEYLELKGLGLVERLPDSLAQLVNLRKLIISDLSSLKSIPDDIQKLPSLHTLELGLLLRVELPSWLGKTGVGHLALQSRTVFRREDGRFSLTEDMGEVNPFLLVSEIHFRAMGKLKRSDIQGALAELEGFRVGVPDLDGFLLTEKGVMKRMTGDLQGALEDLTAAIECFSLSEDGHNHTYNCWKHRGYVKFLMGDIEDAEMDGIMALNLRLGYRGSVFLARGRQDISLGDELVQYMQFRLDGWQGITKHHDKQMLSLHSDVLEKVNASNFQGAIESFNDVIVTQLSHRKRRFFLQERGIVKRMVGDLGGALEDLTAALKTLNDYVNDDFYNCYKHRGYARFLLGDLDGARLDAEKCLALKTKETETDDESGKGVSLGRLPVTFSEYNLD